MDLTKMTIHERRRHARNLNTPVDVLGRLAADPEWDVRGYAANNPNTPSAAVDRLAADPHRIVREAVARRRT